MKKIILADDHSVIRLGLTQVLKRKFPDVEIVEVEDGISLVKEVSLHDFDLVISDLNMPEISGLDALVQIKLIKPNLPVLILSLYTEDLYALRVLKAGASGYLNKNASPDEIATAIDRIILGRKYISPEIAEKLLSLPTTEKKPHELLTNKQFEIFKLLAQGKTITQISETLSSALTTVSTHRIRILEKLNVSSNSELTRYAIAHQLISDISL